jgi:glutaconate CoA-transferase subunit A
MQAKHIAIKEAVECIQSRKMLAIGGMTLYRRPMAFVRTLLKRRINTGEPENITLFAFTCGLGCDLLVGSGMISEVRSCYFGLEIFGLAPMFTYLANRGEIKVVEETEASLAFGLRAQMAGLNFMPGRGWLGTDLPKLRPDVKTITDPYSGETLMAFPAIKPDIAVIHALRVDQDGNAEIGGNKGIDEELALTADTLIVTTEEIVPELARADIPAPFVDYVVNSPFGAAPTSCHPCYALDGKTILKYTEEVTNPESWGIYVNSLVSS